MSSQRILDRYKVHRASVLIVEALAQQLAWYVKITAEDTQFLSKHATWRSELLAELYKHPESANAEIEMLTSPETIEDPGRVARLHYAAAALMVYK